MQIDKLKKHETEEGLTLELVNSKGVTTKASPVLFTKDGEPHTLTKCSKGYWAQDSSGQYIKEKGTYAVFSQRECTVARARYLLYFAEREKKQEADRLYEARRKKAEDAVQDYRNKIDRIIKRVNGNQDCMDAVILALGGDAVKAIYDAETERLREMLPGAEEAYAVMTDALAKGKVSWILDYFGIEKMPQDGEPLYTANSENPDEMRVLKNTFGKDALENYAGDMERHISRLQVEMKY